LCFPTTVSVQAKKEGRKAYQENGNLAAFVDYFGDNSILLADTDETALINVIRGFNPIVIVDESHHAVSALSKETLLNFNPKFVLDLTATPKKEANIISYVDALHIKRENMIKLPVLVYNTRTKSEVIGEAIYVRDQLEMKAIEERERTGRYIRPIALFLAEPQGKDDNTAFEKLKKDLIDAGISQS
jgi:type III restriction enzyme